MRKGKTNQWRICPNQRPPVVSPSHANWLRCLNLAPQRDGAVIIWSFSERCEAAIIWQNMLLVGLVVVGGAEGGSWSRWLPPATVSGRPCPSLHIPRLRIYGKICDNIINGNIFGGICGIIYIWQYAILPISGIEPWKCVSQENRQHHRFSVSKIWKVDTNIYFIAVITKINTLALRQDVWSVCQPRWAFKLTKNYCLIKIARIHN